jgi:hypothetical protein
LLACAVYVGKQILEELKKIIRDSNVLKYGGNAYHSFASLVTNFCFPTGATTQTGPSQTSSESKSLKSFWITSTSPLAFVLFSPSLPEHTCFPKKKNKKQKTCGRAEGSWVTNS